MINRKAQRPELIQRLGEYIPARNILSGVSDRYGYAADASFYRLIPQVVVQPETASQVQHIFQVARAKNIPVVFRAAGSSLSGQSITDGILVDISRYWRDYTIHPGGKSIRLEPGVIGEFANRLLQRHKRRIGPDPASIGTCMIGGIVSNNASGMCCGVHRNSYHTLQDISFILPNGNRYNSAAHEDRERFLADEADLVKSIEKIRDGIRASEHLTGMITRGYQRKNTTGYSLNAFMDYADPFEIFMHLLVGAEGTLAFISEVTLATIADPPFKGTSLMVFSNLEAAISRVGEFQGIGAEAVELMDYASLRSVAHQPGVPDEIKQVRPGSAALLVEFQEADENTLRAKTVAAAEVIRNHTLEFNSGFTTDPTFQKRIWNVRKGLYPSVGAVRKSGSTVIIEDIAFEQGDLAAATADLRDILDRCGYPDGIIFGHAKDGNLHFVVTQQFDNAGTRQYSRLIREVVHLVTEKYSGSLKAEHGTGRNMAPFVRKEWGDTLYEMMRKIKQTVDPGNILNPDVILNSNPEAHVSDLKHLPSVHPIIDTCVECGFCESVCPSNDLTTSPRRRIVLWREMERLSAGDDGDRAVAESIRAEYQYQAVDTCAADGLCALACPVDIDTGKMMKLEREKMHSPEGHTVANWTVRHFTHTASITRMLLIAAQEIQTILGRKRFTGLMDWLHTRAGGKLPGWNMYFPEACRTGSRSPSEKVRKPDLIYFPSCLSRNLGNLPGERSTISTQHAFEEILGKAHLQFNYPRNMESMCCGTPWQSKGFTTAYAQMAEKTVRSLWASSRHGQIPVVMDTSPCTHTMKHYDEVLTDVLLDRWRALTIYDVIEYFDKIVLPRITPLRKLRKVILHPTCSTRKMDQVDMMRSVAEQCAHEVIIPPNISCCGFAGDRGLLHPELTQSAAAAEGEFIRNMGPTDGYYSTSRTCEAGMSSASQLNFQSIIQLIHNALS